MTYATAPMTTIVDMAVEFDKMPEGAQKRFIAELPTLLAHTAEQAKHYKSFGVDLAVSGMVWNDDGIDAVQP